MISVTLCVLNVDTNHFWFLKGNHWDELFKFFLFVDKNDVVVVEKFNFWSFFFKMEKAVV